MSVSPISPAFLCVLYSTFGGSINGKLVAVSL